MVVGRFFFWYAHIPITDAALKLGQQGGRSQTNPQGGPDPKLSEFFGHSALPGPEKCLRGGSMRHSVLVGSEVCAGN